MVATIEQARTSENELSGFLDAMLVGAADLPESRVLDSLVGTFDVVTKWEPIVGQGMRETRGRCEGEWVYNGRMVDTRQFDEDGNEIARHTYAYDRVRRDYVAIALNCMSVFYDVERGDYHSEDDVLVLEAHEPLHGARGSVRVRRTVQFIGDDQYTVGISYPDLPPDQYGPLYMTFTRIE